MDYKARFSPLEVLDPNGWRLLSARDRDILTDQAP
jgi:arginyl-tRNA--protein-N-Asp/Glu arginylyltransferase